MWIMHPEFGFLSIVQKPDHAHNVLTVRSRSRAHLEAFRGWAQDHGNPSPIQEDAGTDYAFRCRVPRDVVVKTIAEAVEDIDYSNFKDECKKAGQPKSWLRRLASIWQQHYQFQQNDT